MKKLPVKTVLAAFVMIMACLLSLSPAHATQLNNVNVTSVRVNDKDNLEFVGWYGVICVDATGQPDTSHFGDCSSGTVYCVTEGETYGRGMMATALSAMISGKKVSIRSSYNQCEMIQVLN